MHGEEVEDSSGSGRFSDEKSGPFFRDCLASNRHEALHPQEIKGPPALPCLREYWASQNQRG